MYKLFADVLYTCICVNNPRIPTVLSYYIFYVFFMTHCTPFYVIFLFNCNLVIIADEISNYTYNLYF